MVLPTQMDLSVIISTYNAEKTIVDCLDALDRQRTQRNYEIIVVDSSLDNTANLIKARFPSVIVLSFPERKYCGDARNIGIAKSKSPVVAFMDADCTVDEDWIDQVVEAHGGSHDVVGSAILNGNYRNLTGWAYYFCEFNLWIPSGKRREISEIAGCALSMKRHIFDEHGPFVEGTYCSDTALHWKMSRHGIKVLFVPSIKMFHTADYTIRSFLTHIFLHRRHYARLVVREKKLTSFQCSARALFCLLLPPVLFLMVLLRVLRSGLFLKKFLASSPLVFGGLTARALGEFRGFCDLPYNLPQ